MDQAGGTARISIDPALCTASGVCVVTAPRVFALPSGAYCAAVLAPESADPALIGEAREAAAFCPTGAIALDITPD